MTSLVLFNSERNATDEHVRPGVDWGTGKRRNRSNSDPSTSHPTSVFLYKGEPTKQNYRNTDITLSNVRINDELIPAPFHSIDLTQQQIPLKFPSNHPFSSHISEKAVFPNSNFNLDDHPSTNTDPYIVTHKIRGNPFRREVHYQGIEKPGHENSKWPDKQYMHFPRSLSDLNASSIYPWPRKMFVPNDDSLIPSSVTNVVKNKELATFETVYQKDFSNTEGLGTHVTFDTTETLSSTDKLKPHFQYIHDPARPMDGMQGMHIHGNHRQPNSLQKQHSITETVKVMSENEKLDDQLRNGTDYVNLPAKMFSTDKSPTVISRSQSFTNEVKPTEIRFLHHLRPSSDVPQIERDFHASQQQIEADNRLQQLEVIQSKDNINLLNLKLRSLQNFRHSRPILPQYRDAYVNTLYDQMGTYVQERSGLYHTDTYDPTALTQSIPELENLPSNQTSNDVLLKDEYNLADLLNNGENVQDKSKPKLFQYKALGDYQAMRNGLLNKLRVPDDASTVDTKVQEGTKPFIQRETVYGDSYNTRKFLQENELTHHARSDPTSLISTKYNRNLERVRSLNSYPMKTLKFQQESVNTNDDKSHDIIVGPLLPPPPYDELYASKYITEHTDGYSRRSTNRVYDSPFKTQQDMTVFKFYPKQKLSVMPYKQIPNQIPTKAKTFLHLPGPERISRYVEPNQEANSTYQKSYKDITFHETIYPLQDLKLNTDNYRLSMKDNDPRFGRTADGRVKQWKLIDLQDRWTKTKTQRNFHIEHPERVPYVGEGTINAKKEILIDDLIQRERMMTVR